MLHPIDYGSVAGSDSPIYGGNVGSGLVWDPKIGYTTPNRTTASYSYPSDRYIGWDPVAAQADWNAKQSSGGSAPSGGGSSAPTETPEERAKRELEDRTRNEINQGYSSYFASLDDMLNNSLPSSKTAQEGIVNAGYDQGVNDINFGVADNTALLNTQRRKTDESNVKNLRDLADDLTNSQMAGSIFLGSRGAGDSSAANQYAYALSKMGSKQRGNLIAQKEGIMNDINDREARINSVATQEKSRLLSERNTNLMKVAQWFSDAQTQVKNMIATGKLSQGKDLAALSSQLLNEAISRLGSVEQDYKGKASTLDNWVAQSNQSVGGARTNITNTASAPINQPVRTALASTPQVDSTGNLIVRPFSQSPNEDDKNNMWNLA